MDTSSLFGLLADDPAANLANDLLTAAGGTVYIVGGAVRDTALGKPPKDIDLMVTGLSGDKIVETLKDHGWIDQTGQSFGVYRFKTQGHEVEIALPRVEFGNTMTDYHVDENIPVEDDLNRRDFTANAMAVDTLAGTLVDPHNGEQDVQSGTLRLVNPDSFRDDPTRLLRGLTAYAKNDLYPDETTLKAMKDQAHLLSSQPAERKQMELDKILSADNPAGAIQLAHDTDLLKQILPEISNAMGFDQMNPHHDLDVGTHQLKALDTMTRLSNDPDLRLAALLHDIGKPDSFWRDESQPEGTGGHFYKKKLDEDNPNDAALMKKHDLQHGDFIGEDHEELGADYVASLMERLRYPKVRATRVEFLVRNHMFPYFDSLKGARKFLARCNGDTKMAFDLLSLREADASGKSTGSMKDFDANMIAKDRELLTQAIESQQPTTQADLAINGNDLIQMGMKPGPEMGAVLRHLMDIVLENPELNNKTQLLQLAESFLAMEARSKTSYDEFDDRVVELINKGFTADRANAVADMEKFLPDYKWSWDGSKLDVWSTKKWEDEDHFERTGDVQTLAQGRIYQEPDYTEIMVWGDRGTPDLQKQAVDEVEDWLYTNFGGTSDIVTYERETPQNDWLQAVHDFQNKPTQDDSITPETSLL